MSFLFGQLSDFCIGKPACPDRDFVQRPFKRLIKLVQGTHDVSEPAGAEFGGKVNVEQISSFARLFNAIQSVLGAHKQDWSTQRGGGKSGFVKVILSQELVLLRCLDYH